MKTAHKVLLIVATGLVAVGALLAGVSFALAGGDINNLSNEDRSWHKEHYTFNADEVSALSGIDAADIQGVRVEGYDGDQINIEYWENNDRNMSIENEDGVLTLRQNAGSQSQHLQLFAINATDHATVISVPEDFAGNLSIEGYNADVSVSRLSNLANLKLHSDCGHVVANTVCATEAQLVTENGYLQADILTIKGTLKFSAEAGNMVLDSIFADSLVAESGNGNTSIGRATAQTITTSSQSGNINLFGCDAKDMDVKSENGEVEVSLPGSESDYAVDLFARVGVINTGFIPESGDRKVSVQTEAGNITVNYDAHNLNEQGVVYKGEALEEFFSAAHA